MPNDSNYYSILGLKPGSSAEEVKRQYRRLAKLYHPDRNNNDHWSQEKIKRINLAYEYLLDPSRKASYDARFQLVRERGEADSSEGSQPGWHPYADRQTRIRPQAKSRPNQDSLRWESDLLRSPQFGTSTERSVLRQGKAILGIVSVSILISLLVFFSMDISSIGGIGTSNNVSSQKAKEELQAVTTPPALPTPAPMEDRDQLPRDVGKPAPVPSVSPFAAKTVQEANVSASLLARCSTVLSKVDALITLGDNPLPPSEGNRLAYVGLNGMDRTATLTRLDNDLSIMKSQRELLGVDMALLQSAQTGEDKIRASQPLKNDLQNLEALMQPLRSDLHALKAIPSARTTVVSVHPAAVVRVAPHYSPLFHTALPAHVYKPSVLWSMPPARPVAKTPRVARTSVPKPHTSPHLSSPSSDEPQFSMPVDPGAGSAFRGVGSR